MKKELISLAKSLMAIGHKSLSMKIIKMADEFDSTESEVNYDKIYSQINSFITDLESIEHQDFWLKSLFISIGLNEVPGLLSDAKTSCSTNISGIDRSNQDEFPEEIIVKYFIEWPLYPGSEYKSMKLNSALKTNGSKDKLTRKFSELINEKYNKQSEYGRAPIVKEDLYRDDESKPLSMTREKTDYTEVQSFGPRFSFNSEVKYNKKLQHQHGTSTKAEDDTLEQISVMFTITIADPKKDIARRDSLNEEHRANIQKEKERKLKEEAARAAQKKNEEKNYSNAHRFINLLVEASYVYNDEFDACYHLVDRFIKDFKEYYEIESNLEDITKEEVIRSLYIVEKDKLNGGQRRLPSNNVGFNSCIEDSYKLKSIRPASEDIPYPNCR